VLDQETVYLNTDNVIALALRREVKDIAHVTDTEQDVITDTHTHPAITRAKVLVMPIIDDPTDVNVTIDSQVNPTWFDFSDPEILKMRLGAATLKQGRHIASLIIYETGSVNGTHWGALMLEVV
jgi:hypothetical protein